MAVKIVTKTITKEVNYKEYYCDECGSLLTTIEDSNRDMFEFKFRCSMGKLRLVKDLCPKCAANMTKSMNAIRSMLRGYGFKDKSQGIDLRMTYKGVQIK